MFDADESERMHDSFTALSHQRLLRYHPPMRPSIPPPAPPATQLLAMSPPLTPQPVHRRRPASPFRMSQGWTNWLHHHSY